MKKLFFETYYLKKVYWITYNLLHYNHAVKKWVAGVKVETKTFYPNLQDNQKPKYILPPVRAGESYMSHGTFLDHETGTCDPCFFV